MCDFLVSKKYNGSKQLYLGLQDYCLNARAKSPGGNSENYVEKRGQNGCEEIGDKFVLTRINKPQTSLPSKTEEDEEEGGNGIVGMASSPCGRWLATLDGDKQLNLWDSDDDTLKHSWSLPKRALVVAFTPTADGLIVADKAGDVYKYDISDYHRSGELLLGHISMLLDAIVSSDGQYLITCDRDEKIRVSCYPNCYNIQSFCLGHKEFISRLKLLPDHPELLLSASGDGTCRIWDYASGKCLCILSCAQDWMNNSGDVADSSSGEQSPAVVEVCCLRGPEHLYIAASLSKIGGITLHKVDIKNSTEVSGEFLHALKTNELPTGMASTNGQLWVTFEDSLKVYDVQQERLVALESFEANKVTEFLEHVPEKRKQRDVSTLFKHYFDNMAEYLKRKEEWMNSGKRPTGRGPPLKKKRKT